jgi:predicted phosphodiesterase
MGERARPRLEGRVFVIGDVHAEDRALETAVAFARAEGASTILCVGDIADGRGDLERTCELLDRAGVICVEGNHDEWALAGHMRQLEGAHELEEGSRAFLQKLPAWRLFDTPLGGLMLAHGAVDDNMSNLFPETPDWVLASAFDGFSARNPGVEVEMHVSGHTHQVMVRELDAPGLPRWWITAGTLRAKPERPPRLVEIDLDDAVVLIYELVDTSWQAVERVPLAGLENPLSR